MPFTTSSLYLVRTPPARVIGFVVEPPSVVGGSGGCVGGIVGGITIEVVPIPTIGFNGTADPLFLPLRVKA